MNCQREISHNQTCGQPTMHICGLGVIRPDERKAFVNTGRVAVSNPWTFASAYLRVADNPPPSHCHI